MFLGFCTWLNFRSVSILKVTFNARNSFSHFLLGKARNKINLVPYICVMHMGCVLVIVCSNWDDFNTSSTQFTFLIETRYLSKALSI